jgi:hypothetical protein
MRAEWRVLGHGSGVLPNRRVTQLSQALVQNIGDAHVLGLERLDRVLDERRDAPAASDDAGVPPRN